MKVVSINCTKPADFSHNAGVTLFRGEKPEVEVKNKVEPQATKVAPEATKGEDTAQPQLKQQLQQDTVELSNKKLEKKCEGEACKK